MKIPHRKKDLYFPILFGAAVLLSVICFASHSSGTSTLLSQGLSLVTTPLRSAAKGVYNICFSAGEYFTDVNRLKEENKLLKKENKKLSDENSTLRRLEKENDSLYKVLELKRERNDFEFTNANIISRSSSGYTDIFTLDKGSFHGVKAGMPVVSDEGALIGITYSVEATSARCKSILSYDVNVGVYNEASGETGILSGSFETFPDGTSIIRDIPDEASVKKGDKILTSGLGDVYPRNLIVGTVDRLIHDKSSHTRNAVVIPHESTFASEYVMIITSFERTYE